MTWTNIPDPATLPSNINPNTPRQGNDNAYRDHHAHHNNLALAVKELVDHVDGLENADGPRRFDVKTFAVVTGGVAGLAGTNPRTLLPNQQRVSTLGPNEVILSGDKILVTNYVDAGGMFDWSKTGIYTVGGTGMTWVRDAEQPREWDTEFPGDTVVPGASSILNFAEFRAVNLGAPGLTLYTTTEYSEAALVAATAIGETYDPGQGQFSNSFDNGTVALLNSVLANGGDAVPYTPGSASDWDTEVTTVGEALDILANRIRQLEL
jgi:hypothetical protein